MVRSKRKNPSLFTPFFIISLFIVAASFFIWNKYYSPEGLANETTIVEEGETTTVRLGESQNFIETKTVNTLLEGESVRSKDGGTTLIFFDKSTLALDSGTTVDIIRAREKQKDSSVNIHVRAETGRVWLKASQKINPESSFLLDTKNFTLSTRGGEFSVDQNSVMALSGSGTVSIGKTYSKDIEVGQALVFQDEDFDRITAGEDGPGKTRIPVAFQESDWFVKNSENTVLPSESEPENEGEVLPETLNENENSLVSESESETKEEAIFILFPGENGETIEINKDDIPISGTVPVGTQKVIINDYTLSQFTPGDTTFKYNAAVKWNTLKEGRNEYTVVALGKDGKRYEANITLVYSPKKEGESTESEENTTPESEDATTGNKLGGEASGELTINTPKEGESLSDDVILVSGDAPKNASRIRVNDYVLTLFSPGSTTWNYKISSALGNRTPGEFTIVVEALDKDGKVIESVSRKFTIRSLSGTNDKYAPKIREDTLPPVKQDDFGEPTI